MPDNTELQDCPSNPDRMTDDDLHFVLIEHDDEDGLVRVSTGDDGFERNRVKNDAFHLLQQMKRTWKKNHGFCRDGSGLLRDTILTPKPERMADENKKLSSNLMKESGKPWSNNKVKSDKEAARRLSCPSSKVLQDIERVIAQPDVLVKTVKECVKFIANIKCAKSGEPLFSKESWKVCFSWLKHMKKGCISDKQGMECHHFASGTNGKQVLHCVRGMSQLEGFHGHLRDILQGSCSLPLLLVCLLAVFVH